VLKIKINRSSLVWLKVCIRYNSFKLLKVVAGIRENLISMLHCLMKSQVLSND